MTAAYSPTTKVAFARRLAGSWTDLADLLEVAPYERERFPRGDTGRAVWEWLEDRNGLDRLRPALIALDRLDLVELLDTDRTADPAPLDEELTSGRRAASAWRLADDPDATTFWLPRARGVEPGAGDDSWRFRGRRAAIGRIGEHLASNRQPAPLVVLGEPGSGKSALLAHVLVLADPQLRQEMPRRYRTAGTARLVGAVDVAVRATGKTLESVCAELARAARLPDSDEERLAIALHRREGGFRVVVDGLDEAREGHVRPIATLLRRLGLGPRIRVVVGLRRAPARSTLDEVRRVALAATAETTVAVDEAPYLALGDVMDLVQDRLEETGRRWRSPYAGKSDLAERVAGAVATRSRGNFLVAQMTSRHLATSLEPVDVTGRRWWGVFPTDVEGAMDDYIARFGNEARQREVRELLTPLAFALGDGLPDSRVWSAAATALSRPTRMYSIDDVHRILDDAATYLVAHVDDQRLTYRLFHDALAQYLRSRCLTSDPRTDLVRAWRRTVPTVENQPQWAAADPYLTDHLAEHATGTDELDELIRDLNFVVTAHPIGLVPAMAHAVSPAARRVARAYRLLPAVSGSSGERAASLTLSAQQLGDEELRDAFASCGAVLPWRATGGAWRPPDDHTIALWLDPATTATTLLPGPDGSAVVVSGEAAGRLHVWELVGGIAYPPSGYGVHKPDVPVVTLAGGELEEGRHLLASAGREGSLRLWYVDAGLLVPLGAELAATDAVPLQLAVSGSTVVLCDDAGGIRLIAVGSDGLPTVVAEGELPGVRRIAVCHTEGGPVVIGGTVDGAVTAFWPDGRGGFVARTVPVSGRWTVGAIATMRLPRHTLIALGTGGRELHLLVLTDEPPALLATATDVASAGVSALAFVPTSPILPPGLLLGDHDGLVRFWALDQNGDLTPRRVGRPHLRAVTAMGVVRTAGGPVGVSCDADGKVSTWPLDKPGPDRSTGQPDVDLAASGAWSVVLREDRAVECWTLDAQDRLVLETSVPPAEGTVVNTVDRSGNVRTFHSDLAGGPDGTGTRRRPVPLHPYRSLTVGTGDDGGPIALALRGDGVIEAYARDLTRTPEAARTWTDGAVSVSLDSGPSGAPVVSWGDVEGVVRLRPWAERAEDWSDTRSWGLGRVDVRTALAGDVLLTGDASGAVRLWSLADGEPHPRCSVALTHDEPVTAVALDGDEFAVSGDRSGRLFITAIEEGHLDSEPAYRIDLGATVLSIGRLGPRWILVWCRLGAVVLTWGPSASGQRFGSTERHGVDGVQPF